MAFSLGNITSFASGLSSKIDVGSITDGLNIGSIKDPGALSGISSSIEGKINSLGSSLTSEIESAITTGDIESAINGLDIEGKVNGMLASQGFDGTNVNIDEGQINSMIEDMVKSTMGNIGLDSINYG